MGHIFSKKEKKPRVTEQDKAILQLKHQRDKLKQYQRRIENTLESDRGLAKKLINDGKKERAKLLLRKKRYQEQLLDRTDKQLENLEKLTHDIEFAQIEITVVEGLRVGNEALKKVNDALNIEDIERILDETREGVEKQQEIDALLSGVLTEEDEDAVLAELDTIISETLPEVPNKEEDIAEEEAEEDSEKEINMELPEVPEGDIKVVEMMKVKSKERIALEA